MTVTRSEEVPPMQTTINEILTCPDPLIGMRFKISHFFFDFCFGSIAILKIKMFKLAIHY